MTRRQIADRYILPPLATLVGLALRLYPRKRHLRSLAAHLVLDDGPEPSDVIVVLGGGSDRRARMGARLFKSGMAPKICLFSAVEPIKLRGSGARTSRELLLQQGVPPGAILHDRRPRTTLDEARLFADHARERGWRSALVVTDPYHTRRAIGLFRRVLTRRGPALELRSVGSGFGVTADDDWWESREACAFVLSEYAALVLYTALRRI